MDIILANISTLRALIGSEDTYTGRMICVLLMFDTTDTTDNKTRSRQGQARGGVVWGGVGWRPIRYKIRYNIVLFYK